MSAVDRIIRSEAAGRMLETVSDVYDEAVVGLSMFEAMGREFDEWWQRLSELLAETRPDTASWTLSMWEERYGIEPEETLPILRRRKILLEKIISKGAFTPVRVINLVESMWGGRARVDESLALYTFLVETSAPIGMEAEIRQAIGDIKPAHMAFDVKFERQLRLNLKCLARVGAAINMRIRQVDKAHA